MQTNVGDGLLLNDEAGNLDGRVELWIVEGALAFRVDGDDAVGIGAARFQVCNLSRWMPEEVSSAV